MELTELSMRVDSDDENSPYYKIVEKLGKELTKQFMEEIPAGFDLGNFSKLSILIPLQLQANKKLETPDFINGVFIPKNGLHVTSFVEAEKKTQKKLLIDLLENALIETTLKRRAKKEILRICRKLQGFEID